MQRILPFFVLICAFFIAINTQAQGNKPQPTKTLNSAAGDKPNASIRLDPNIADSSIRLNGKTALDSKYTGLLIDDVNKITNDTTGSANILKRLMLSGGGALNLKVSALALNDSLLVDKNKKASEKEDSAKTRPKDGKLSNKGEKVTLKADVNKNAPLFKENTLVDRLLPQKVIDSTTNEASKNRLIDSWKEPAKQQPIQVFTKKDSIAPQVPRSTAKQSTDRNIHVIQDATNIIGMHKLVQPRVVSYPVRSASDEAMYMARLSALQTIVPMTYNNIVKYFIDMYVYEKRDQVNRMLTRSDLYMTLFEEALDRHGLPAELKYLPIIESALVPHAKAENGRSGLWQLSYTTAKEYGLESNNYIDERRDPRLSTEAAAMHLKNLYRRYLDWQIVIAAYNCGEAEVNKAIQKAGGVRNYWELATFLDIETQAYVPLFIAATYIMEYYNEHDFHKYEAPYTYYVTDTVFVKKALTLREIAKQVNMDVSELQFLNPAIVRDVIPLSVKGYPLTLPGSKAPVFVSYLNNLENRKEINLDRTKETSINLPRGSMWNQRPDNLGRMVGPPNLSKGERATAALNTTVVADDDKQNIYNRPIVAHYQIRRGDTMQRILQMFPGVSADDIRKINNIKGDNLINGMTLKIPSSY